MTAAIVTVAYRRSLCNVFFAINAVQGDHSPWRKPPVDIDVKVVSWYKVLILKRNFKSLLTGGLRQGEWSPCK